MRALLPYSTDAAEGTDTHRPFVCGFLQFAIALLQAVDSPIASRR